MPRRVVKPFKLEVEFERKPLKLGEERRLKKMARSRAPKDLEAWHNAETAEDRFYAAPRAGIAAFNLEQYELAEQISREALSLARKFVENWNYGNAVHFAHTTQGLVALQMSNRLRAVEELKLSGATPGSPQLGSFGPTMQLAKALLKAGERNAVIEYFNQCQTFWQSGEEWLKIWKQKVESGVIPNFFMHSYR